MKISCTWRWTRHRLVRQSSSGWWRCRSTCRSSCLCLSGWTSAIGLIVINCPSVCVEISPGWRTVTPLGNKILQTGWAVFVEFNPCPPVSATFQRVCWCLRERTFRYGAYAAMWHLSFLFQNGMTTSMSQPWLTPSWTASPLTQFGLNSKVTQWEEKIKKNNNFAEPKATISEVVHLKTLQKAHLM